jgi:hypothetical protein
LLAARDECGGCPRSYRPLQRLASSQKRMMILETVPPADAECIERKGDVEGRARAW